METNNYKNCQFAKDFQDLLQDNFNLWNLTRREISSTENVVYFLEKVTKLRIKYKCTLDITSLKTRGVVNVK